MEAVLFIGIQAAGKSSFYRANFSDTHIRINLDMLKTRRREKYLFECCLDIKQPFVIDNTNVSRQDRERYIPTIQEHGVTLRGYYFDTQLEDSLARNAKRVGQVIRTQGILNAYSRLELPSYDEGFFELYRVRLCDGGFDVSEWEAQDGCVRR